MLRRTQKGVLRKMELTNRHISGADACNVGESNQSDFLCEI